MRSFDVDVWIDAPVTVVYTHLSDPHNFLGLQPLLVEMSPMEERVVNGRSVIAYETVEAFRIWGKLTYLNRIQVEMTLIEENVSIETAVKSKPNVTLRVIFRFAEETGGTRLTETMEIHAPRLLMGFVYSQAHTVQQQMLQNLKERLESA